MAGNGSANRLLLLYTPGLDSRRLTAEHTPYIAGLLQTFPHAALTGYPSVEHLSTVITGMRPHEHGIWLAKLKSEAPPTPVQRLIDTLPDIVTTTAQCVVHAVTKSCQMGTIPPRRRRHLHFEKMKFYGRVGTQRLADELASHGVRTSLLSALGTDRCRYVFTDRFVDRDWLLNTAGTGECALEIVQFHALDILEHWHLETPEEFHDYYGHVDAFVRRFHERCQSHGVTLVLLSDHGQEQVRRFVDLKAALKTLEVPEDEYTVFVESMKARFWFHTSRSRDAVMAYLSRSQDGVMVSYQDMHRYLVEFPTREFGEVYFVAHPGSVFFPDDFFQPVVNLYFGLKEWQKRRRLTRPILRGQHGYLPMHPSEQGLMAVLDQRYTVDPRGMELRDVAPSLLGLLGEPIPAFMKGTARFRR